MGSISQNTYNDGISVAQLETISLGKLERKDASEVKRLLAASIEKGFFYLDFSDSQASGLPIGKEELLDVMKSYFNQSSEIKAKDSLGMTTRGYVSGGTFSAVDREKPKESFEHLALGSYELRQDLEKTLPKRFQEEGTLVQDYVGTCEHVVDVLLDRLSDILGLDKESHLSRDHQHTRPSDTILALLSYPGQLTHQKHTDLGSLTVLFSDQWGLQVVTPKTGQWEWVEPRTHHAVINIGDTLRFLSGKKLFSCLHRVIREGRASHEGHRYSIAYLLRPNDEAEFEDADDEKTTARDFVTTKYNSYTATHDEQEKKTVLTGGMEQIFGVKA